MRANQQVSQQAGRGRRPGIYRPAGKRLSAAASLARGLALSIGLVGSASAAGAQVEYASMAPVAQYRSASQSEEVALARSAAPGSISKDATVLVLGEHGYDTAVKGTNGFVCLVERSWAASFGDRVFWNPKIRGPICMNPAAAGSVLPAELERTQWVLSGVAKDEMIRRTKTSAAANTMPAPGSIGYMMSRHAYLSDTGGHWHPHLMLYEPHTAASAWGANLPGSPVLTGPEGPEPTTVFFVPVTQWSDGTLAGPDKH